MTTTMFELVKTHLKYYKRSKSVLMGALAFPLIFIGVFGVAFQYSAPGTETIPIGIIHADQGIPDNAIVLDQNGTYLSGTAISDKFVELLGDITFEDNKTKVFDTKIYKPNEESKAIDAVNKRDILALLYINEDFSQGFMALIRASMGSINTDEINNWQGYPQADFQTNITLKGDQSLQSFAIATSVIQNVVDTFFNLGMQDLSGNELYIEASIDSESLTAFDYVLPGLVIFALLNTLGVVAQVALRDVNTGLLERLRISNIQSWEYAGAIIIGQLIVSIIQIPIMFFAGSLFGFDADGNITIAYIFAILISLSMTGIGLIIAGLVKNEEAAGSLSAMVSTPMAFLASVFFIVPNPVIIESGSILGENSLGVFDLLPPTSAIEALRLVLLTGKPLSDVWYQFALLSILTIFYLLCGILVYSKKHLTPK
ncbi:MAG: ABC transporter permease [Candidatus Kariarchaeaceae archaeon]|jgi:ABC-2 type transport system permease protein